MPASVRETKFQKKCIEWVEDSFRGRLIIVNNHGGGYTNKGFPDLTVFGRDRAVVIELKGDSGYRLQTDQLVWKRRFERVGTHHRVVGDGDFDGFKRVIFEEFPDECSVEGLQG